MAPGVKHPTNLGFLGIKALHTLSPHYFVSVYITHFTPGLRAGGSMTPNVWMTTRERLVDYHESVVKGGWVG